MDDLTKIHVVQVNPLRQKRGQLGSRYTWKQNVPCFDWKRRSFGGKTRDTGVPGIYIYIHLLYVVLHVSLYMCISISQNLDRTFSSSYSSSLRSSLNKK